MKISSCKMLQFMNIKIKGIVQEGIGRIRQICYMCAFLLFEICILLAKHFSRLSYLLHNNISDAGNLHVWSINYKNVSSTILRSDIDCRIFRRPFHFTIVGNTIFYISIYQSIMAGYDIETYSLAIKKRILSTKRWWRNKHHID